MDLKFGYFVFAFWASISSVIGQSAQNILINGGFEEHSNCTESTFDSNYIPGWGHSETYYSSYINRCNKHLEKLKGGLKYVDPHSGDAYAAFYDIGGLVGTFMHPMKSDSTYLIEAFISLAPNSAYSMPFFGLVFEDSLHSQILQNTCWFARDWFEKKTPDALLINTAHNSSSWVRVSTLYTAKGGENIMYLGGFKKDNYGNKVLEKDHYRPMTIKDDYYAYFYIDDISVTEYRMILLPDIPLVLNYINFAFNSSELLSESFPELNSLVDYLRRKPTMKIEICGHTDNIGSAGYNKILSSKRAEAVRDYIISRGIINERITTKGYGFEHPIATNETEEGRGKNRRIEIKLVSNDGH